MLSNGLPAVVSSPFSSALPGPIRIGIIYWFNPANIGDTVLLQNEAGATIWQGRCETANQSQIFQPRALVQVGGYAVPTLTSGTLYLYPW